MSSNDVAVDPQVSVVGAVGGGSAPRGAETPRPHGEAPQLQAEAPCPQAQVEAGLPHEWREHVRELRAENARRRKENAELRAQLAALQERAAKAEAAQAAAAEEEQRSLVRLRAAQRRLKLNELARLTAEALDEAAARLLAAPPSGWPSEEGAKVEPQARKALVVDMAKARRLLARLPAPVDVEADLTVDEDGRVSLEAAAAERLRAYAQEVAELASAELPAPPTGRMPVAAALQPPPVGGEPPRAASPGAGRLRNCWDEPRLRPAAGRPAPGARQAPCTSRP